MFGKKKKQCYSCGKEFDKKELVEKVAYVDKESTKTQKSISHVTDVAFLGANRLVKKKTKTQKSYFYYCYVCNDNPIKYHDENVFKRILEEKERDLIKVAFEKIIWEWSNYAKDYDEDLEELYDDNRKTRKLIYNLEEMMRKHKSDLRAMGCSNYEAEHGADAADKRWRKGMEDDMWELESREIEFNHKILRAIESITKKKFCEKCKDLQSTVTPTEQMWQEFLTLNPKYVDIFKTLEIFQSKHIACSGCNDLKVAK